MELRSLSLSLCLCIFLGLSLFLCFSHLLIPQLTLSSHISHNHTLIYSAILSRSHMQAQSFSSLIPIHHETTCLIYRIHEHLSSFFFFFYRDICLCIFISLKCFQNYGFVSVTFSKTTFRQSQTKAGSSSVPPPPNIPRVPKINLKDKNIFSGLRNKKNERRLKNLSLQAKLLHTMDIVASLKGSQGNMFGTVWKCFISTKTVFIILLCLSWCWTFNSW